MSINQASAKQPGTTTTTVRTYAIYVILLIAVCALSLLVGFCNSVYFRAINDVFHFESRLLAGVVFSSFLVILGGPLVIWRPRLFGFQVGDSLRHWRLILGVTLIFCALTALALSQLPRTPFSGADAIIEVIVVPFSEELLFRGVIFAGLLIVLNRLCPTGNTTLLAVIFSGISFGLAHANNIISYPAAFVVLQVIFATAMGLAAGYLRARTSSVLPTMLLHGAANFVVVLF